MRLRGARAFLLVLAVLIATVVVPAAATAATTIHVVERATTDAVTNGSKKDREGNVLTFHNKVYDAQNKRQVGRDAGFCVRTVVGKWWECSWTTFLKGGSISVQGPFSDRRDTVLAVTGGTGIYAGADGTMDLKYHNKKGTAFDFIFRLED